MKKELSREAMVQYLKDHFRYNTMNSWNQSTSYAQNLKIHRVIPQKLRDQAYALLAQGEVVENFNDLIRGFDEEQGHYYQAGFNGRSGGYLVLYCGSVETKTIFKKEDFKKDNGYHGRVYADNYGWKSYAEAKAAGLVDKQIKRIGCFAGRSIDQNEDFSEWDIDVIRERYILVKRFDKLCADIIKEMIYACKHFKVVKKTIEVKVKKEISELKEI
jgi:hypothetical protein